MVKRAEFAAQCKLEFALMEGSSCTLSKRATLRLIFTISDFIAKFVGCLS